MAASGRQRPFARVLACYRHFIRPKSSGLWSWSRILAKLIGTGITNRVGEAKVEFQYNEEGIKAINEWYKKKIVELRDKEAALQSEVDSAPDLFTRVTKEAELEAVRYEISHYEVKIAENNSRLQQS